MGTVPTTIYLLPGLSSGVFTSIKAKPFYSGKQNELLFSLSPMTAVRHNHDTTALAEFV